MSAVQSVSLPVKALCWLNRYRPLVSLNKAAGCWENLCPRGRRAVESAESVSPPSGHQLVKHQQTVTVTKEAKWVKRDCAHHLTTNWLWMTLLTFELGYVQMLQLGGQEVLLSRDPSGSCCHQRHTGLLTSQQRERECYKKQQRRESLWLVLFFMKSLDVLYLFFFFVSVFHVRLLAHLRPFRKPHRSSLAPPPREESWRPWHTGHDIPRCAAAWCLHSPSTAPPPASSRMSSPPPWPSHTPPRGRASSDREE